MKNIKKFTVFLGISSILFSNVSCATAEKKGPVGKESGVDTELAAPAPPTTPQTAPAEPQEGFAQEPKGTTGS